MKFSIESEQSIIGGLLQVPEKFDAVNEIVSVDDFYNADNREIYSAIETLSSMGKPIDSITVAEYMNAAGDLERVGGFAYLLELVQNTSGVANILAYSQIVSDRAMERRIAATAMRVFEIAENGEGNVDEKLNAVHAEFASLERNDFNSDAPCFNDLIKAEVQDLDEKFRGGGKQGLKIGLSDVDERFGGIEETDFWVLAARPSMGKTTLALNIAYNVAAQGKEVLIFSLEISKEQMTKKLLSAASGISYSVLRSGQMQEPHWPSLSAGVAKLKDKKIHIIDIAAIDVNHALAIARKYSRKGNIGLVVIDYLQLMTAKSEKRFDEISYVSRQLKVMAKTVKAPVMALSQLSRKCEERANKRPINSDLRESGQIEQDADIISFIYRDEVYNPDSTEKGIAELITSKFRNGECGTDYLAARLDQSRFDNMSSGYRPAAQPEQPRRRSFE